MRPEDPLYQLIKKHGKNRIRKEERPNMVRIIISNPLKEVKYVPKSEFISVLKKQGESELEEMIYRTPGPYTYTEAAKKYLSE